MQYNVIKRNKSVENLIVTSYIKSYLISDVTVTRNTHGTQDSFLVLQQVMLAYRSCKRRFSAQIKTDAVFGRFTFQIRRDQTLPVATLSKSLMMPIQRPINFSIIIDRQFSIRVVSTHRSAQEM